MTVGFEGEKEPYNLKMAAEVVIPLIHTWNAAGGKILARSFPISPTDGSFKIHELQLESECYI